jgi:hypothetical protein
MGEVETAAAGGGREIYAMPGAAPAGAVVRAVNLDRTDPPSVTSAKADGSFALNLAVTDGEELRFDWFQGDRHGEPRDARFVKDPTWYHVEPSTRFACVGLTPGYAVDFSGAAVQTLVVHNGCTDDVTVSLPRLRLGVTDFALATTLPVGIGVGENASLEVDFARSQATAREDILFFDVTLGAQTIRYPITLLAPAVP